MSTERRPTFDALVQELAGAHAIEASAGTGKTYAITLLWLRLLVEERVPVDRILVATFTKAATAELAERLLGAIDQARAALAPAADGPVNDHVAAIVERARARDPDRDLDAELLRARSDFDLAPICTLHGFCQTLIARHGLELGCESEVELHEDCRDLLDPLVDDVLVRHADSGALPPKEARGLAARLAEEPGLATAELRLPAVEMPPDEARAAMLRLEGLREEALRRIPELHIEGTAKPKGILKILAETLNGKKAQSLAKKAREALEAQWPEFLDALDRYPAARRSVQAAVIHDLVDAVRRAWPEAKAQRRVRTFDDLLTVVRDALAADDGTLATAIRGRFRAVIIDECQDSDGIQIEVFARLFCGEERGSTAAPTDSFLVIGDPKQSIYRFRGADLASYRSLVGRCRQAPEMRINHRSDPALIDGLNHLYAERPTFAGGEDARPIAYVEIDAAAERDRIEDAAWADPGRALVGMWTDHEVRELADYDLARRCAREIERLLAGGVRIVDRQEGGLRDLAAGDIAVLASDHKKLGLVRARLRERDIPSQQGGRGLGSVFASDEATDLLVWLEALTALEEGGGGLLGKLLALAAGPLIGLDAPGLAALADDAEAQADLADRCRAEAGGLRREGPLVTLLRRLDRDDDPPRLLRGQDGERTLTNWRHLADLLGADWADGRRSAAELRLALARRMADPEGDEGALIRLETDRPAVQLVTVHGSKGLEYPVVFCPFLWSLRSRDWAKKNTKHGCAILRRSQGPLVDLGSDDLEEHLEAELDQEHEEEERRTYVALTRARHRCYVGLARVADGRSSDANGSHRSPLAQLLGLDAEDEEWREPFARALPLVDDLVRDDAARDAGDAAPRHPGGRLPELDEPPAISPWRGPIHRTTSFSGLERGHDGHQSPRDRDPEAEAEDPAPSPAELAARSDGLLAGLGSGTRLGDRTHDLLEQAIDKRLAPDALVAEHAERADRWRHALATVLDTPIAPIERSLADCAEGAICEMHFLLPLDHLDPGRLADALLADRAIAADERRRAWARSVADWSFSRLRGYLQGYIDLTLEHAGRWYVCDYKTNRLAAYDRARCEEAMLASSYLLQARLYQVALHRHLRHHLADYRIEEHLGGMIYLFLRGFPDEGVWHEPADPAGVAALDALFAEAGS